MTTAAGAGTHRRGKRLIGMQSRVPMATVAGGNAAETGVQLCMEVAELRTFAGDALGRKNFLRMNARVSEEAVGDREAKLTSYQTTEKPMRCCEGTAAPESSAALSPFAL